MRLLGNRPPRVDKLRRRNDVEGLVGALGYEDLVRDRGDQVIDLGANVRRLAAEALGEIEGQAAFAGLVRALDDPEESVRIMAVRGLSRRGDPLAAEQLTSAVTNWTEPSYARARKEALDALAYLRDPTAPRRVVAGMIRREAELDHKADAEVLRRLAQAGGHDAVADTIEDLVARLGERPAGARVRRLLVWLGPASVDPLIRALGDNGARHDAIFALGAIHDSKAVERLCSILLGDDEPAVRTAAAWALGEIKDPSAVETLLVATGDVNYGVRHEANRSFDKLGNAGIAIAMSALIRPALENGAGPQDATVVGEGDEDAQEVHGQIPAAPGKPPRPGFPSRPKGAPITDTGPMLRRLLGRRPAP